MDPNAMLRTNGCGIQLNREITSDASISVTINRIVNMFD